MPNFIPMIKPYLKRRRFEQIVKQAEKAQTKELENFEEAGFESKENYKEFLKQRDKSSAIIQQSAQNFAKTQKQTPKMLADIEKTHGKNSPEADFAKFALSVSPHVTFESTLKNESKKLQAVTPTTFKKPRSKKRKIALGVLGGISALVVGDCAYSFWKIKNDKIDVGPEIITDPNLPANVVDPTKPQIPDATVEEIVKENDDLTPEQVQDKIIEVIKSSDYQKQATELAEQTNAKLEVILKDLNQSYANIEDYVNTNFPNAIDEDLIDEEYSGGLNRFVRDENENVVTFIVRGYHHWDSYQRTYGTVAVDEFKSSFPNLLKYYEDNNVEVNVENIFIPPESLSWRTLEKLENLDYEQTGNSYVNFVNRKRYNDLQNTFGLKNLLEENMDTFKSKLSSEQLQEFEKLLQESNSICDDYVSTINDYNSGISQIQQELIESLIMGGYDDDLITGMLVDGKDSDQTFDDLVEHFANQKQQSNTLDNLADASDNVIDAVSDALDDALSM